MSATPIAGQTAGASPSTKTPKTPKKAKHGPRPKHVPQRTCIACRTAAPKRSFVRVVRLPTGEVVVDPTGKKSGRGASICGTRACWAKALAGTLLDRALRVTIGEADRAALRTFLETLPEEEAGAGEESATPPATGGTAGATP